MSRVQERNLRYYLECIRFWWMDWRILPMGRHRHDRRAQIYFYHVWFTGPFIQGHSNRQYHSRECRYINQQYSLHSTISSRLITPRRSIILSDQLGFLQFHFFQINAQEAAIAFLETVDLHSLNLATPQDTPVQRTTPTSTQKHRAPSLPLDTADPLNALPPDTNDSALKSLAGALEASYRLLWNKVQLVEPPRTLDDVRKLISRPFTVEENTSDLEKEPRDAPNSLSKLIVGTAVDHKPDDPGRGNLMYFPFTPGIEI